MNRFELHLSESGLSKNTIKNYMSDLRLLCELGLDSNIVSKLKSSNNRSASSINRMLSTLRRYSEFEGLDIVKDTDFIKMQTVTSAPDTVDRNEVLDFLKELKKFDSYRNYAIACVIVNTGLRISECLKLRLSDLSTLDKGHIDIIGKGNKLRRISLNESVIEVLKYYLKHERIKFKYASVSEYVFVSNKGCRLDPSTVQKIFKYRSDGMIHPHMLRHFFATNAYELGLLNLRQLQEQLGHSNLTTVQKYTHPSRKAMLESLNRDEGRFVQIFELEVLDKWNVMVYNYMGGDENKLTNFWNSHTSDFHFLVTLVTVNYYAFC